MSLRTGDRIVIRGAGPAGCSVAIELARRRPGLDIQLVEAARTRPGAGVVVARAFFESLAREAPDLLDVPQDATASWDSTLTRTAGFAIESPAHGTVAFSRSALIGHLRSLASASPGVTLVDGGQPAPARDPRTRLVVGAEGVDSPTRSAFDHPTERGEECRTLYVWASIPRPLPAMFDIHDIAGAGMVLLHAYPHSRDESTVVIEALAATVTALGLRGEHGERLERRLGSLLAGVLDGAPITCHTPTWRSSSAVRCAQWYRRGSGARPPTVLIGDAAHAMHYSIGIGTTLAVQDGRALAAALAEEPDLDVALERFCEERQPVADAAHVEAESSRRWFEDFIAQNRTRGAQTVFAIRSRREMNTYAVLAAKDRRFAHRVTEMIDYRGPGRFPDRPSGSGFRFGDVTFPTRLLERADLEPLVADRTGSGETALVGTGPAGTARLALVPAAAGPDRTSRVRTATRIRRDLQLPVIYVHDRAPVEELDTLIAAGCIDLAVDRRDVPTPWHQLIRVPAATPTTGGVA